MEDFVRNGVMEPSVIFKAPFNRRHELGVAGVFDDETKDRIIECILIVNQNADAVTDDKGRYPA